MDEQFDNKLTNHIRKVFDDYEHPGAEHGWAQLKNRFPVEEKGRKITWLWWGSAAAVILVFLGIGLWYNNGGTDGNSIAVKSAVKHQNGQPFSTDTAGEQTAPIINNPEPVIAGNNPTPVTHKNIGNPANNGHFAVKSYPNNTGITQAGQTSNVLIDHPQPAFIAAQPVQTVQTNPATTSNKGLASDSQKVINNVTNQPQMASAQPATVNGATQLAAAATNNNGASPSAKKTMADMFNEDKRQIIKQKDDDNEHSKKVNFSIYAATYFNYAEGSTNQINAGAGFTSDFKLSKNLKLSTGIALAQNSLNYNNAAPQAAKGEVFAAAPPLKQASLFAAAALVPVFKNYNASLVGLDIPINIKYEFNPQKTDAYILAGVSSGTFIDESYTYRYNYSNGTSIAPNSQTEQTAHNSFNSFYFAKTLNLSFGVGYPLGKNRLIVEPFVKYPLGGLGAQDIRFGAGGVNLKFSFKGKK
ncbi:PorT family protein [Mucilaginibacter sp. 14171R-50]|uniref:outer membrane beta-barrel protein n=1 Tax=Mucilaginibacter sp. 14171R-50 TaxID=2703789 RepID=UPI00138BA011|nr:outer membrane beta-barrel protein [Mucilaginibacter sp. 14171R-50]QHS56154.1 PorT family protein [Mucilaginibacter sp. 14171R-50]